MDFVFKKKISRVDNLLFFPSAVDSYNAGPYPNPAVEYRAY